MTTIRGAARSSGCRATNRAARGLASLYVQANQLTLQEAGRFHAQWTPRGWSDPSSHLVAFEQLLYLRQPGYGTSYIIGKLQFERLISDYAHQQELLGRAFNLREFFAAHESVGVIPFALVESEMIPTDVPAEARHGPDVVACSRRQTWPGSGIKRVRKSGLLSQVAASK